MTHHIRGLHHITAIAGTAQRNFDFYTRTLGQRLVKKTVNFDDPGTYHLYYGDESGTPGSIMTFFPWEGIRQGRSGSGMVLETAYAVPPGSLAFWKARLTELKVPHKPVEERFGLQYLSFTDPDGLQLSLVEAAEADGRSPWLHAEIPQQHATRGFHDVTISVRALEPTARVLTDVLGYRAERQQGNRSRFMTPAATTAHVVDIMEEAGGQRGLNAGGTYHHVAFRVPGDHILMEMRERVLQAGLQITEKIDRNYFYSLYFREPGGVLFELASDNPGFAADEPLSELGTHLMLPPQYEPQRRQIEAVLPVLKQ